MSVESFLSHQHDRMIGRVERKVVGEGRDHITAYPLMGRIGVALVRLREVGVEERFYGQLHQDLFQRLAQAGIEAEIYRLRGDITGNDKEVDSRAFLRVTARRNSAETKTLRRDDILSRAIVISNTDSIRNKIGDS